MVEISASILSIKNEEAIKTLYNLETAGINYFHIDVMDGKFVKENTSDRMIEYCEYINSISNLPLDVHLMVDDVKSYINSFLAFEPNIITFHLEAGKTKEEIFEWINLIKENNVKVGISIKPNTNIKEIYDYLPFIHMVLVMTVEPGKGGQELIESTISKIKKLKEYIIEKNLDTIIEADGGINNNNISKLKDAGLDIAVAGSYIVNSENKKDAILNLK